MAQSGTPMPEEATTDGYDEIEAEILRREAAIMNARIETGSTALGDSEGRAASRLEGYRNDAVSGVLLHPREKQRCRLLMYVL